MATATASLGSSASLGSATDVGSGGAPASGGGDSELGQLLGSAYDSATGTEDVPPGEGGTPESQPVETPAEVPPGEAPAQPQQTAPQAQAQPTEAPFPVSPDGKSYMVPKEQLPAFQAAQQFSEAVQQFFGTPQEAQSAYLQASDLRTMQNDWVFGSPEAIQGVMAHFSGMNHQDPAIRARFQQSFGKMLEMAPAFLKQSNPQAYQAFVGAPARFTPDGAELAPASGLLLQAVEAAYERAAQTGNPEDFKQAQYLDFGVTGKYKNELPKVDPRAQEISQFEQQRAAFDQRQNAALTRDVQSFNQSQVEGSKFTELNTAIDKMLAQIKDRYSDIAYQDLKNGIQRELVDAVKGQAEFWLEHEQTFHQLMADYRHTWQQGNPGAGMAPRIAAYKADFMRQANRLLPSIAQKRIGAATQRTRAANGQFAAPGKPAPQAQPQQPAPQGQNGNQRLTPQQWDDEWSKTWQNAAQSA